MGVSQEGLNLHLPVINILIFSCAYWLFIYLLFYEANCLIFKFLFTYLFKKIFFCHSTSIFFLKPNINFLYIVKGLSVLIWKVWLVFSIILFKLLFLLKKWYLVILFLPNNYSLKIVFVFILYLFFQMNLKFSG